MKKKIIVFSLILIILLNFFLRYPYFYRYDFPISSDPAHYLTRTKVILDQEKVTMMNPYHHLGVLSTSTPGVSVFFSILILILGIDILNVVRIMILISLLLIPFSYLFLRRYYDEPVSLIGALLISLIPFNFEFLGFGGYANLFTLTLIPITLFYLLEKKSFLFGFLVTSIIFYHNLTTLFLGLCVLIYLVISFIFFNEKKETIQTIMITLFISLPLLIYYLFKYFSKVNQLTSDSLVFSSFVNNFIVTSKIYFSFISLSIILFSIIGLGGFILSKNILRKEKSMVLILITTSLFFINSYFVGLSLPYNRFVCFLGLPLIVLTCFIFTRNSNFRNLFLSLVIIILLINAANYMDKSIDFYHLLDNEKYQGLQWLKNESNEIDVIVSNHGTAAWVSFLTERPTMDASPQYLVGTSYEAKIANDASSIFYLNENYEFLLKEYKVKYIVITKNFLRYVPNDLISKYDQIDYFKKVYENDGLVIFKVV